MALFRRQTATAPKTTTWHTPSGEYYRISDEALTAEHTLIAGTTGCGKSTFLHSIMHAFLIQNTPADARLVLIDPKRVELSMYKKLPHTIEYANNAPDALSALRSASAVMEQRYAYMEDHGLRKYTGYSIYIIIDELADLMLSNLAREIQDELQHLLQLGRAAGLHVIAATQCPNRQVIKAQLVCNFTARFGLKCQSPIESRQIVGFKGCEDLPKFGAAIFTHGADCGAYKLPYIKDEDIQPLINWWTSADCKN